MTAWSETDEGKARIAAHEAARAKVNDPESDPTTPQLKGQIVIEMTVEQNVDYIAYFARLSERDQERYAALDLSGGYEEYERPSVFLTPEDDAPATSPLPWIDGVTWHENVEIVEWDAKVLLRTGYKHKVHSYSETSWRAEDLAVLRANVPWLDAVHTQIEALAELPDEEREAEEARIPGPMDDTLEGF